MRWVYIINGEEKISLSEGDCRFLESEITSVETKTTEQEIAGRDGVLIGANTFNPFELVLKFYYEGIDNNDLLLFAEKIKKIIHARNAMYVVHSQMPGRKYAFNSAKIGDFETITNSDATFTITFNCFKGYSESLKDTSEFSLSSGDWQFEAVARADNSIKYTHTSDYFDIYNGSSDTIDPLLSHKLQIQIKADAPEGITIRNLTTEDKFVYKKPLTPSKTLTIQGLHPLLDGNRVGIDTNWQWITLAPGYNTIKIENDSIKSVETKWNFNFIYR